MIHTSNLKSFPVRCDYFKETAGAYFKDMDTSLTVHKFRTMGKALDSCDISELDRLEFKGWQLILTKLFKMMIL